MTMNTGQQQRLRCYIEPNGSGFADHSGTIGDFWDVPAIEGSIDFKPDPQNIDKKLLRQERDQWSGSLRGTETATMSFEIPWFLSTLRSVAGGSPAAIAATPTSKLLAAWLGGCALGTSMDADADCTVSLLKTADNANALEGCGVAWADTTGRMFCREVVKVDTDLTLDQALPSAPVAADYLYRGIDLYLANRITTNVTSFQFLLNGPDYDNDCWLMQGGQCLTAPVMTFKNGERPTIKFSFDFAKCSKKHALLATNPIITYTNVNEVLVSDGIFTAYAIDLTNPDVPVAIKSALMVSDYSFDFASTKYQKITSPGTVGSIGGYIMVGDSPKVVGKFTLPWEVDDETFYDLHISQAPITMNFQVGSSETAGCFMIKIGGATITDWQIVRKNGLVEQEISWSANIDYMHETGIDTCTELAKSPVKIYMF